MKTTQQYKAVIFSPDGKISYQEPKGAKFSLEELQGMVGGYMEVVGEYVVLADEEGRLKGLPLNKQAIRMFSKELVGNVVVVPREVFD